MSNRGFSMTELMVTLAVIGLLAAFTAPNVPRWSAGLRLNSLTREIASELQLARVKAIAQNTSVSVCFYGPNARFPQYSNGFFSTHLNNTDWCNNIPAAGTAEFHQFAQTLKGLPPGITVTPSTRSCTFNSRGAANSYNIDLINPGARKTKKIKVLSSTGRIRICDPETDPENCS